MLRIILILFILLVIFGLAGFDVKSTFENERVKSNIEYVTAPVVKGFNTYIKPNLQYVWNNVFLKSLWKGMQEKIEEMKNGNFNSGPKSYPQVNK